jgi:hypothetical protein
MLLKQQQVFILRYIFILCHYNVFAFTLNKCCPSGYLVNPKSFEIVPCIESSISNLTFIENEFLDDFNFSFNWSITNNSLQPHIPCENPDPFFRISKNFTIDSGSLVDKRMPNLKFLDFCLDQDPRGRTLALTCPCVRGECVNVCCGKNMFLNVHDGDDGEKK